MTSHPRFVLSLLAAGLVLVALYVRAGGEGLAAAIPWIVLPPLVAFVGVSVARNALRQLGPPTPGSVFQVFAFWTVIVLAYEIALKPDADVRVGAFVARVFLVALGVTMPYALSGVARRLVAR